MRIRLKKLIAMTLASTLMLGLLPVLTSDVLAASVVRTTQLDLNQTSVTYMSTSGSKNVDPRSTNITDCTEGWSWAYATKTITLDGIDLQSSSAYGLILPANATIFLVSGSVNTIRCTHTASANYAIYSSGGGTLTIDSDGTGTLNVYGGGYSTCDGIFSSGSDNQNGIIIKNCTVNVDGGTGSSTNYAIRANGPSPVEIINSTVTAIAGTGINSYGIRCSDLTVIGSVVNAAGAGANRYGIDAVTANIYSGTVTAKGGMRAFNNAPTISADATVIAGANYDGTDATEKKDLVTNNASYKYVQITAIGGALPRTTALDFTVSSLTYISAAGSKTVNPTNTNITDSLEGWAWYKSSASGYSANTLVLDGMNLSTTAAAAVTVPGGATVTLQAGSVSLVSSEGYSGSTASFGLASSGNLTLNGTGALTVKSSNSTSAESYAIRALTSSGMLTINGGEITAIGGTAGTNSMGMVAGTSSNGVTINGGTVTAIGGSAGNVSYGIRGGDLKINDGTVSARGKSKGIESTVTLASGYGFKEGAYDDNLSAAAWVKYGTPKYSSSQQVILEKVGDFSGGTGTSEDPYLIKTVADLQELAGKVNAGNTYSGKYFTQANDIALTGEWTPIGTSYTVGFGGSYDGCGYTVSGMLITTLYPFTGFFGSCLSGSQISNLTLQGSINITSGSASGVRIGGLAGDAYNIDNVEVNVTISASGFAAGGAYLHVGGITGGHGTMMKNCRYTGGSIAINQSSGPSNGVMIGGLTSGNIGTVANSYVKPGTTISGKKSNASSMNAVGGIYGRANASSITLDNVYVYNNTLTMASGVTGAIYGENAPKSTTNVLSSGTAADMLATLNARATAGGYKPWYADSKNENGGYPVLRMSDLPLTYTITYDANGGDLGSVPVPQSCIAGEADTLTSEIPTREGYTFLGWSENVSDVTPIYTSGDTYTGDADIILYAVWSQNRRITEVNDDTGTSSFSVTDSNLDDVIESVVKPDERNKVVSLTLNVTDNANPYEVAAIKTAASGGSEVYFFNATLTKTVDGSNTETLSEVPVPVEIHIKLNNNLAGKTYYRVYRYHGGKAEQISNDPSKSEHYTVDVVNSKIIIRTMKFSTYAIFGNDAPIGMDESYDVDVQAKITGEGGAVYKIDLAWGAMTFEYSTASEWNPETHSYISGASVGWLDEGFMNGNNQITAWNHSNGNVNVSFNITEEALTGVTMKVNTSNVLVGTAAVDMPLSRVQYAGGPAQKIDAFLLLDGKPDNVANALGANYSKIAVITVTIEAVAGSDLTPK